MKCIDVLLKWKMVCLLKKSYKYEEGSLIVVKINLHEVEELDWRRIESNGFE